MSNLEHITNKILADAKIKKESILAEARAAAEAVKKEAAAEAVRELEDASVRANEQAARTKDRVLYGTERRARDVVLAAKREAVERVFKLAEEKLIHLDDQTYLSLLKQVLEETRESTTAVELNLPPGRLALVSGSGLQVAEVKEDVEVRSGFKLTRDGITVNYDFIDLLHYLKDDLLHEVALVLEEKAKAAQHEA